MGSAWLARGCLPSTRGPGAVTEGLTIRIVILVLVVAQAIDAAILGFNDVLPLEWKIVLVATSAGVGVALNQITSWQSAPAVERATRKARAPD